MIPMSLPEIARVVGGVVVHDSGVVDDGPAFGAATNSVGECGATSGPKTAIATIRPTIARPMRVRVRRADRRRIHSHWWPRSSSSAGA